MVDKIEYLINIDDNDDDDYVENNDNIKDDGKQI